VARRATRALDLSEQRSWSGCVRPLTRGRTGGGFARNAVGLWRAPTTTTPNPSSGPATAEDILAKVARIRVALEAVNQELRHTFRCSNNHGYVEWPRRVGNFPPGIGEGSHDVRLPRTGLRHRHRSVHALLTGCSTRRLATHDADRDRPSGTWFDYSATTARRKLSEAPSRWLGWSAADAAGAIVAARSA
jgi:hypothetical protein